MILQEQTVHFPRKTVMRSVCVTRGGLSLLLLLMPCRYRADGAMVLFWQTHAMFSLACWMYRRKNHGEVLPLFAVIATTMFVKLQRAVNALNQGCGDKQLVMYDQQLMCVRLNLTHVSHTYLIGL